MQTVEKWGVFEVSVHGPQDGNPFTERQFGAVFRGKSETVQVDGFYDGEGVYRVCFMPSFEGAYTYETRGNFPEAAGSGEFTVTAPAAGNHGPMRVVNQYHFAYEDGTPYYSVGTTCYAWAHQPEAVRQDTLRELDKGYFNKMRFCVFPKHYIHNFRDPETFPYEGTPVDSSGLTSENFSQYTGRTEGNRWDFTRFNPAHFRRLEACVLRLRDLGIEADLIGMHPYDRWGFSRMTPAQDDLYWRYLVARFAAFRNVWWSLANEYDLMPQKSIADWERFARILCEEDPYGHLRSIHNCLPFYDHTRPWITHASIQRQDLYRTTEYVDEWRVRYGKPVVCDEIAYEGDIQHGWGNISPEELTRRFWEAVLRGGYAGHGETYLHESGVRWWSHGGALRGGSPARIAFLRKAVEELPGGLRPWPGSFDETCAVLEGPQALAGGAQPLYLYYYGFGRPSFRDFFIDEATAYRAEILDTWNMTATDAGVHRGRFRLKLPGRPYMAVRLRAVEAGKDE